MEYVYAAVLLHKANKEINDAAIKKVLEAAGVTVDDAKVKALVAALDGVDIEEAIKTASVAPVAAPVAASTNAPAEAKKEDKKEAKKEESNAAAGLGALFG